MIAYAAQKTQFLRKSSNKPQITKHYVEIDSIYMLLGLPYGLDKYRYLNGLFGS